MSENPITDEATLLEAYQVHLLLLEGRSESTVNTYTSHIKAFLRWLSATDPPVMLDEVSKLHIRAFLLHEANRGLARTTRSTTLFALRSFWRFLVAEDIAERSPAAEVTQPCPIRSRVEFYSDPEADAIIAWTTARSSLRWRVGAVMLLTLRYTGLRVNELVSLKISDVDLAARRICLVGKGGKPRVVPFPHLLQRVLVEYLEKVRPALPASPYLFANPRGNRRLRGRYGRRALEDLVAEAGTSAGVTGRHFPHRWRHTYATSLVRRGEDIHVLQRLMGHSNIATTSRYLHLSDTDLVEAVDRAFGENGRGELR